MSSACLSVCYDNVYGPRRDNLLNTLVARNLTANCVTVCEVGPGGAVSPLARVLDAGNTTFDAINPLGNPIIGLAYTLNLDSAVTRGITPSAPAVALAGLSFTIQTQSSTTSNGANLVLLGGDSTVSGNGGTVEILSGDAVLGDSGELNFSAGFTITGNGGAATFSAGATSNGIGGGVSVSAGQSTVSGPGGVATMSGGNAMLGNGGTASVLGGTTSSGIGGAARLIAGSSTTGNGGQVSLAGGFTTTGNGGQVSIAGGFTSTGGGGDVSVIGGTVLTLGSGGTVRHIGGNGIGFNENGGSVQIVSGQTNSNTGNPGNVQFVPSVNTNVVLLPPPTPYPVNYSSVVCIDALVGSGSPAAHFAATQLRPPTIAGAPISPVIENGSTDTCGRIRFTSAVPLGLTADVLFLEPFRSAIATPIIILTAEGDSTQYPNLAAVLRASSQSGFTVELVGPVAIIPNFNINVHYFAMGRSIT
jgi:hypothetical protein